MNARFARVAGTEARLDEDVSWFRTSLPLPQLNAVLLPRFGPDAESRIDAVEAAYGDLPHGWWITPSSRPSDLGERLASRGLRHVRDMPGMDRALDAPLPEPRIDEDVSMEAVEDEAGLERFIRAHGEGFEVAEGARAAWRQVFEAAGLPSKGVFRHWVATVDGKLAGTASLVLEDGVAGVYNVSTLPRARRRGLGTALTVLTLERAREAGARVATLLATPPGEPVYRKLGFEERVRVALWARA